MILSREIKKNRIISDTISMNKLYTNNLLYVYNYIQKLIGLYFRLRLKAIGSKFVWSHRLATHPPKCPIGTYHRKCISERLMVAYY